MWSCKPQNPSFMIFFPINSIFFNTKRTVIFFPLNLTFFHLKKNIYIISQLTWYSSTQKKNRILFPINVISFPLNFIFHKKTYLIFPNKLDILPQKIWWNLMDSLPKKEKKKKHDLLPPIYLIYFHTGVYIIIKIKSCLSYK